MSSKLQVSQKMEGSLELIYDLMKKANVAKIQVDWDGSGDDGQIHEFTPLDENDHWIQRDEFCSQQITDGDVSQSLEDYICQICYDVLNDKFGGWEDNMGSQGTFVFSAKDRKCDMIYGEKTIVNHEHNF